MVPKDVMYTGTLGSPFIAFYDLLMMNIYYNCTDICKGARKLCRNGGFLHPRNCSICICPSGYGGQFCNERPPGCGQVLKARERWRTLEDNLTDSHIGPDGFKKCTYWIRAPKGERVEVRIMELPVLYANDGCVDAGVEIKTHRDKRRTGYRFCSSAYLDTTLISHSHMVPVISYSREGLNQKNLSEDYYVDEGEAEEEGEDQGFGGDSDEDEDEKEEEELLSTSTKLLYRIFRGSE